MKFLFYIYIFLTLNVTIFIIQSYQNYIQLFPFYIIFLLFNVFSTITLGIDFYLSTKKGKTLKIEGKGSFELPTITIIIPTLNEPLDILLKTIKSVLNQNYPKEKIHLIISDDGRSAKLEELVNRIANENRNTKITYFIPPPQGSKFRRAKGKAGNLNSVFEFMDIQSKYVETRDADDYVLDTQFLIKCISILESNSKLAYIQTKKICNLKGKDRFGNQEELFYSAILSNRNKINASFPCGSGLVWRKEALIDIGLFPGWNIVEDFLSGVNAHRKGWKSAYVKEIIGAITDVPPLDIPNFFKQRGTWALDSIRFLLYGKADGLNFNQKLSYFLPGLLYILSIISYIFSFLPALAVIIDFKLISIDSLYSQVIYSNYLLLVLIYPFLVGAKYNIKNSSILKNIRIFLSLGPVFLKSFILAVIYGSQKKPKYVVTRKNKKRGLYIGFVIPQIVVCLLSITALFILTNKFVDGYFNSNDLINLIWICFYLFIYYPIIRNSISLFK